MCQHAVCVAEMQSRSKDCDVTIVECIGSGNAFPIPFPFLYLLLKLPGAHEPPKG